MAHFAEIDADGTVLTVIVVDNKDCGGLEFPASEAIGQDFIESLFGGDKTRWKQTSYNDNFRFNYAAIGGTYDADADAFVGIKPFESWVLNTSTYKWEAPIPKPSDGTPGAWAWDETTGAWITIPVHRE